MQNAALQYCCDRHIRRREPIYSANRLCRLCGKLEPDDVTENTIADYRRRCVEVSLSPRTIESSVSDLIAVVQFATGRTLQPGRRLRLNKPEPQPVPLDAVNECWPYCERWLQQWIVLSYWTCLRMADAMRLQLSLTDTPPDAAIVWQASKTEHRHRYPLPDWLRPWLTAERLPFRKANDFAFKTLRSVLTSVCRTAGVDRWTPKLLRQRALTEWSSADAMAGRIIHGCGLGVLQHYVDPLRVLSTHQHKVRLPSCFGAGQATPDISVAFRRLDLDAQQLVCKTIERLTG